MKIIISGPKASGKSTLGKEIADSLSLQFYETDTQLENIYTRENNEVLTFREIYKKIGEQEFRNLEHRAVNEISSEDWCVIATGGSTMINSDSRNILLHNSISILLKGDPKVLWNRIEKDGIPSFLSGPDGYNIFLERNEILYSAISPLSDIVFTLTGDNKSDSETIIENLAAVMMLKMTSPNTFGEIIRTTTFGESHGPAIGAVLDGIKPGIPISIEDIQSELDRRRPGQSSVTTARKESDTVHILSGIFEGKTTGTPICLIIYNKDQDSTKYEALKDLFRPGHADFTFWKKYGIRDHKGGGRSSARETAGRVAAGSIAKKILADEGIEIIAFSEEIAGIKGVVEDYSFIEKNSVRAADPDKAQSMEDAIKKIKLEKDSTGGVVKLIVRNLPAGIGDPVFYKLDARIAMSLFSIGAVKGVEIGSGFESARMKGSENNDQMDNSGFLSNNSGGILGGISTGQDVLVRIAVKPTPSIFRKQKTVDKNGHNQEMEIEGRHDPCIVPRIIPIIESMASLVILDAVEINRKLKT